MTRCQPLPQLAAVLVFLPLITISCAENSAARTGRAPGSLVHLEDQLERAVVTSGKAADSPRREREWSFAEPRPEWRAIGASVKQEGDHTQLTLESEGGFRVGGIATDVEESPLIAWTGLLVKVRSSGRLAGIAAACNVDEEGAIPQIFAFFTGDGNSPVFNDGSVQSYLLPFASRSGDTLQSVGVFASSPGPASFDLLSVKLVPRGAGLDQDVGVTSLERDAITRRTLYAHAPASMTWNLRVPDGGRLDVGLSCLSGESVAYKASVSAGGQRSALLDETIDDPDVWHQRSLDLTRWAGKEIELQLEAGSAEPGAVALFGAPILSGTKSARKAGDRPQPNVIFYVIDGGGADFMSLYGYNRRTTPFLERLAEEGVVFENAYSNSTWTQPSTASFMTSLQHSVLGGLRRGIHSTPVPAKATTMAEHMRGAGYQTASFTTNPNCARVIGLERGVDWMRDIEDGNHSTSSAELHERYWDFRDLYPGQPYWVHFQTTDVHEPNEPVPPYAGLYVSREDRERLEESGQLLFQVAGHLFGQTGVVDFYDKALELAEIDRIPFFNARRGLYDETMAFQDRELARLVERLKAEGEWENTLLIIGSDHGHPAGTFARFGHGLLEPQPEGWQGALFDSFATHVPLIFFWPGKIPGGRRIEQPVSMIDVLPTILELLDLRPPEILMGRSLAPVLLGGELEPRPVILDEFRVDEATGAMIGNLEMIDGRWGASLQIGARHVPEGPGASNGAGAGPELGRHAIPAGGRWGAVHTYYKEVPQLLLYDLWRDPFATTAVNDEHPELVETYRKSLLEHWSIHRALATRFTEADDQPLTPQILEQLRALGYVR